MRNGEDNGTVSIVMPRDLDDNIFEYSEEFLPHWEEFTNAYINSSAYQKMAHFG